MHDQRSASGAATHIPECSERSAAVSRVVGALVRYRSPLVIALGLVMLGPYVLLEVDLHHDGYVLAGALAVRDGGSPHSSAFMQYGPILPMLQAVAGAGPGSTLVGVRVLSLLLLLGSAALVVNSGSEDGRWPISNSVALAGAAGWILLADQPLMTIPFLPWVSTLGVLLLSLVLWLTKLTATAPMGSWIQRSCGLTAGTVVGILLFVRPQMFFLLLSGSLALALLAGDARLRAISRYQLMGAVASSITGIFALSLNGSLDSWFLQSIAYPFDFFVVEQPLFTESQGLPAAMADWFRPAAVACLLAWSAVTLLQGSADLAGRPRWDGRLAILLGVVLGLGVAIDVTLGLRTALGHLWILGAGRPSGQAIMLLAAGLVAMSVATLMHRRYLTVRRVLRGSPQLSMLLFLLGIGVVSVMYGDIRQTASAAGVILGVAVFLMSLRRAERVHPLLPILSPLVAAGFSEALSTGSSRHFWAGLPFALLLIASLVSRLGPARAPLSIALAVITAIVTIPVSAVGLRELVEPHERLEMVGPASGMLGLRERSESHSAAMLREEVRFLDELLGSDRSAIYLVDDGFYSVATGRYASVDEWFVRWGPVPPLEERLVTTDLVVTDGRDCPECARLDELGWILVGEGGKLAAWRPAGR